MQCTWQHVKENHYRCSVCGGTLIITNGKPLAEAAARLPDCGAWKKRMKAMLAATAARRAAEQTSAAAGTASPAMPSLHRRVLRWAEEVRHWKAAGKLTRSDTEVERIYSECCEPCVHFLPSKKLDKHGKPKRGRCGLCGCCVNKRRGGLFNKIRMATTRCPADPPKWRKEVEIGGQPTRPAVLVSVSAAAPSAAIDAPPAPDFTIAVAVDRKTAEDFRQVWPVWRRLAPWILDRRLVLLIDSRAGWRGIDDWLDHPHWSGHLWPFDAEGASQRERMLSAFVLGVPDLVETPYWLKIDVDALPVRPTGQSPSFPDPAWFADSPALISNPWGYTKPGEWVNRLESWAETIPDLARRPPLGLHCPPGVLRFRHRRIISWMCFVRTDWSREVAAYVPDRLPVPSQDTFHWYCAARRGDLVRCVNFKNRGWKHAPNDGKRGKLIKKSELCL
jgi:hypothetical protein